MIKNTIVIRKVEKYFHLSLDKENHRGPGHYISKTERIKGLIVELLGKEIVELSKLKEKNL
tara:strand:+ start:27 stop:209 length:183 start_codon:yes stop_codon:yes gene_type:complete